MSRVLFVMLHPGFVRYYDHALDALAAAGHDVHVAFEINRTKLGEDETARRLATRSPRLTCGTTPERRESVREFLARGDHDATRSGGWQAAPLWSREGRDEAWESLRTTVRLLLDYLRFFDPVFRQATELRARAEKRVPHVYRGMVRLVARSGSAARRSFAALLSLIERTVPPNPPIEAFVREHDPDVLLVTPLVELGSQQVDYIKAARRLGVRSALCVASWDNLTSKGLMRIVPDHVVVWNEAQKREAVALHGVLPEQVVMTGAQPFDRWFDRKPGRSRAEFCGAVGLEPDRPFVLYVGSSVFIAPDEVPFVERWAAALRESSDPIVSRVGILIRPHPANARQWRSFDTTGLDNIALWPPIGTDPNAPDFQSDYFDSLYHSAAVIGINTSAQLEAAIVGRPVFTIRAPEFTHAHEGTLHFQHLVGGSARLVHEATSLDDHVGQLGEALTSGSSGDQTRGFVRWFIRPFGLDVPAVPRFLHTVEELASCPRPHARDHAWWLAALRPPVFLMACVARTLAEDRPIWVYAMRPFIAVAIALSALAFYVRDGWRRFTRGVRRTRRRAHGLWYESSQDISKRMRRARKKVAAGVRGAGRWAVSKGSR